MTSLRCLAGSFGLLALLLFLNACSTSGGGALSEGTTLRGTVYDSTGTFSLADSAYAVRRDTRDTIYVNEEGEFEISSLPPGLYVFDAGAYGYHTHRHLAVVAEPGDSSVSLRAPLLPQTVQADCDSINLRYHRYVRNRLESDSNALQVRILDMLAEGDSVFISSALISDINNVLFLPNNFNRRGHYEIILVNADGDPVPYSVPDQTMPSLESKRIYERGDVVEVVPDRVKRLNRRTLLLTDRPPAGSSLFARLRYTFSLNDTLRPTPETDFTTLNLDSLQVPVYDTTRVPDAVMTPDSLVVDRDTTIYEITGNDTTVTRRGYLLYKTARDTNATRSAQEAASLLYVPDSIKTRARLDSLGGDTTEYVAPPIVENPEGPRLYIVPRTDSVALDTLLRSDLLAQSLQFGLPDPGTNIPRLLAQPQDSIAKQLRPPVLPLDRRLVVDSLGNIVSRAALRADSIRAAMMDSLRADSLRMDSLGVDSMQVDSMQVDSMQVDPAQVDSMQVDPAQADSMQVDPAQADSMQADTIETVSLQADSVQTDSLRSDLVPPSDSLRADSLQADSLQADSLQSDSLDTLAADSVAADSTAPERGDPFLIAHTRGDYTHAPARGMYWSVPRSLTTDSARVLVVDPLFYRLRASPAADTTLSEPLSEIVPQQISTGARTVIQRLPQQIILVPTGGYREKYLVRWRELQQSELEDPYCDILRLPMSSPWTSTTVRPEP